MNDNQNLNANVLKKIEVGNPLVNLGLWKLYDEHQACRTDEQLAAFYHRLLTCSEGSTLTMSFAYQMIAFSQGMDKSPLFEIMDQLIEEHNED